MLGFLLRSPEVMIRQQKGPFKEVLEDLAENVREVTHSPMVLRCTPNSLTTCLLTW